MLLLAISAIAPWVAVAIVAAVFVFILLPLSRD